LIFIVNYFAVFLVLVSAIGFVYPSIITWFKGPWITYGLGFIMLSMGLTLDVQDFKKALSAPLKLVIALIFQYTIMPSLGYGLAILMDLNDAAMTGLVLVACCPGGTASNVITYLAKANLSLSVAMTALSTIFSALLTPLITSILLSQVVEVSILSLFIGTIKVVIVPVLVGLYINFKLKDLARKIGTYSPVLAVILISLIVSSIIAQGKESILQSGISVFIAVFLLHVIGFGLAGLAGMFLNWNKPERRALSIEVGMQNSGLAVVLARANFADPFTAIPAAVSSLTHSLIGSALASIWRRSP
jgi:bile acid:Na+ symporter, BASS family